MVVKRFGSDNEFLQKVSPSTQVAFGKDTKSAVMGDYPTLNDIDAAYGKGFSTEWMIAQIVNLSESTGAKNLTENQLLDLASIIATEYRHLKVTEILLFFYRFKTGRYGRFYGSVDPMVVTCAIREFVEERNQMIDRYDQEEREQQFEEYKRTAITHEEYLSQKDNV